MFVHGACRWCNPSVQYPAVSPSIHAGNASRHLHLIGLESKENGSPFEHSRNQQVFASFACLHACKKDPNRSLQKCPSRSEISAYIYSVQAGMIIYHLFLPFKSLISFPIQTNMTFLHLNSNISNPARGLGSFGSFDWMDPCTPKLARNANDTMLVFLFDVLLRRHDYQRCRGGTSHDIAPF